MKEKNYSRVKQMIESDRFGLMGDSKNLILRDISALMNEYFILSANVEMEIEGEENDFTVTVVCRSSGVKRFNVLK